MGFLNGRVSFSRYRVNGPNPLPLSPELIDRIVAHSIGKHGLAETKDGVSFGWTGGDHLLDIQIDLEKNILEDCIHLAIRIDADKIPSSLLKAYTEIELKALAAANPMGRPTKAQRAEAKELALAKAEQEAADGRFLKMRQYPVLWDARAQVLYVGSSSQSVLDRVVSLFQATFEGALEPMTAGTLAANEGIGQVTDEEAPSLLRLGGSGASTAWSESGGSNLDYLGNEFLVWLWHTLQTEGDVLTLEDSSEISVMLAKTLVLDCPRGETGRDQLSDAGPTRLPEAFRALQAGKLPRRTGLILDRQGMTYELTLQAETFAVSGASLPKIEDVAGREASLARIESLRHMVETLDLLYKLFLTRRSDSGWPAEIGRIRRWLEIAA